MRWNSRRYLALGAVAAFGGLVMLGGVIALVTLVSLPLGNNERQVTVIVNGQSRDVSSRARTIADLLDEQRIRLGEGDTVSPALNQPSHPKPDCARQKSPQRLLSPLMGNRRSIAHT